MMTHTKRNSSLRAGLIAGVAFLAISGGAAVAGEGSESLRRVLASDGEITASEAKRLAEEHMGRLGFTAIGKSQVSAGIRKIRLEDGVWRIVVAYGGSVGNNRTTLLFDASDGRLLASDLVEYVSGIKFKRRASQTEMAESEAENN